MAKQIKTPHYLDYPFTYENDFLKWTKGWIKAQIIPMIEAGNSYEEIKANLQYDKQNKTRKKKFDEIYASLASYKKDIDSELNLNKYLIYGGIGVVFLFVVFMVIKISR